MMFFAAWSFSPWITLDSTVDVGMTFARPRPNCASYSSVVAACRQQWQQGLGKEPGLGTWDGHQIMNENWQHQLGCCAKTDAQTPCVWQLLSCFSWIKFASARRALILWAWKIGEIFSESTRKVMVKDGEFIYDYELWIYSEFIVNYGEFIVNSGEIAVERFLWERTFWSTRG